MARQLSTNERVLRAVKVDTDNALLSWFQPFTASWQTERSGSMPTAAMLASAAMFTKRGLGREAVWHAMAMRPEGVTVAQYLASGVANGTAHNHLKALCDAGYFVRGKLPGTGNSIVFTAEFTSAGETALAERLIAAGLAKAPKASKPVKVKAKANRKKAPEAPTVATDEPVSEPATEVAPAETATPAALEGLAAHFNS